MKSKHTVRIVGGQWKRTPISVIDAPGLRPSGDRVRETLFNWINHFLGHRIAQCEALDLFAGTGVLGLEAASRGFKKATLVELNRQAYNAIEQVQKSLQAEQVQLYCDDACNFVKQAMANGKKYDCIFLDPPFQSNYLDKIVPLCTPILRDGGLIYIETDHVLTEQKVALLVKNRNEYQLVRKMKAGLVFGHLLHKNA